MAISYAVFKTGTTIQVQYRAVGPSLGIFTYNQNRGFLPFDLLSTGLSVSQIESVDLIFTVVTLVGGGCTTLITSASNSNGFGATLDATHDDWASTTEHTETLYSITATGTYTIPMSVANLDFSGTMYYRMRNNDEGAGAVYSQGFLFNSATAASRRRVPVPQKGRAWTFPAYRESPGGPATPAQDLERRGLERKGVRSSKRGLRILQSPSGNP